MTYLEIWSRTECFVREQICEFCSALRLVSLILVARSKNSRNILEIPLLDVVVLCIPPMDIPFDGISFVADNKANAVSI